MTMPGIAEFRALLIKAEVGDFSRFPNERALVSYAGLVPSSYSSGARVRFGRITKQGSPYLRWAMIGSAQQARPSWGTLYDFFERISVKSGSRVARVALARKMLSILWTMVRKKRAI